MNKKFRLLNAVLATSTVLLTLTIPPLAGQADEPQQLAVGTARLSATRGVVEVQSSDGTWQKVQGSVLLEPGHAVRTAANAEAVATFQDGSTVRLADNSAIKVTQMAQAADGQHLAMKVLGDVATTWSPNRVAAGTVDMEFPMGHATINHQFAIGRAVRPEIASGEAQLRVVTVTGSDVRLGVEQGAVTMHDSFNVRGNVVAVDPSSNSFSLLDESTQQTRRIVVSPATQLASANPDTVPPLVSSDKDLLASLVGQQEVVVYGVPVVPEGPGDGSGAVNATTIYPHNADTFNGQAFLNAPQLPAMDDGPTLENGQAAAFAPSGIGVVKLGLNFHSSRHNSRSWPKWQ